MIEYHIVMLAVECASLQDHWLKCEEVRLFGALKSDNTPLHHFVLERLNTIKTYNDINIPFWPEKTVVAAYVSKKTMWKDNRHLSMSQLVNFKLRKLAFSGAL